MTSDTQIAKLAGFYFDPGNLDVAITATAIALAESKGNARAHNSNAATRDDSYGLWQVNMYGDLGPARRREFDLKSNSDLYDENTNARVAGKIYQESGFTAWSQYKNGEYKKYLDRARTAANAGGSPVTGSTSDLPLDERISDALKINPLEAFKVLIGPLEQLIDATLKAAAWVGNPENWIRIVQVAGGVGLGLIAINIVASPVASKAVKQFL